MRRNFNNPASHGVASFLWNASRAGRGTHDLVVKVYAGSKLISTISGLGTVGDEINRSGVDTKAPIVVFANIKANETLTGTKEIKISAADDSGEAPLVSLLVDSSLKLLKNVPPYTYSLDTTTYEDGSHQLETYAYDNAGNQSDPAVINVSFKNGADKPAVTTMSVTHQESSAIKNAIESKAQTVVPSIESSAADSSAARATSINAVKNAVAAPVAQAVNTAKPNNIEIMAENALKTQITESIQANTLAIEPGMIGGARVASAANITAQANASIKSIETEMVSALGTTTQPTVTGGAKISGTNNIDIANTASIKSIASGPATSPSALLEPLEKPVQMAATNIDIQKNSQLRNEDFAYTRSVAVPAAPELQSKQVAKAQETKPAVKVALTPTVKDVNPNSKANAKYSTLPLTQKSTKAKLEKSKTISKGKVKARDFFENLGGILFWDNQTKTVTVIAKDMQMDFKVGSKTAYVNGEKMQLKSAPYVANGRTIIDASAYSQALALAKVQSNSVAKTL